MCNAIQECATFLSSFIIAFSVSWEASLVTYSILPVSFIALYIAQKVSCSNSTINYNCVLLYTLVYCVLHV